MESTFFFDRYIGNSLLRKSGIHKIVDKIMSKGYEYPDSPLLRLLGKNLKDSPILQKVVKAKDLLINKILLCFASGSAYRTFQNDSFYGDYGKDTFYRFDQIPTANWERLESSVALNVIQDIELSSVFFMEDISKKQQRRYAYSSGRNIVSISFSCVAAILASNLSSSFDICASQL